MSMSNNRKIVYILTNDAMPGLIKIGKTETSIEQRMKELYKTGVPVPFECFHASIVENADEVESRLHQAFDTFRVNNNREFFEMPPENALAILELLEIKDVTPKDFVVETDADREAMKKLEKKSERFSFKMVDIPEGSELVFDKDENLKAITVANNKVLFDGEEMSLSAAALRALRSLGYKWKSAQGAAHWKYNGELLKNRRERMEDE